MQRTDSRFESILRTIPSLNGTWYRLKRLPHSNVPPSAEVKLPVDQRKKSATIGVEEGGAERIENEGKANNGAFSLSALTLAAIIGTSARTVDLRPRKIELSS